MTNLERWTWWACST